jgi:hypothetical protein
MKKALLIARDCLRKERGVVEMVKLIYSLDYMGQEDAFFAGDMPPAVCFYF